MARRIKSEIKGLPGFFDEKEGGHGFKGRHFYNPTTGQAMSTRAGRDIIAGRKSFREIVAKKRAAYKSRSRTKTTKTTVFSSRTAALQYIKTIRDKTGTGVSLLEEGYFHPTYEGATEKGTRTLQPRTYAQFYDDDKVLVSINAQEGKIFKDDYRNRYIVYEVKI